MKKSTKIAAFAVLCGAVWFGALELYRQLGGTFLGGVLFSVGPFVVDWMGFLNVIAFGAFVLLQGWQIQALFIDRE